jgi:hypothetical protein
MWYGAERAEHYDIPPIPDGITAPGSLALGRGFTKAQFRAASLPLARELHPGLLVGRAGPAVRKMKEAALMRVKAARHKLAPQAL